jgi:hypothetical protein
MSPQDNASTAESATVLALPPRPAPMAERPPMVAAAADFHGLALVFGILAGAAVALFLLSAG